MKYQLSIICFAFLLLPLSTSARETIVSGSIGTGLDFWERTYDNDAEETDSDRGDKKQIKIWPAISITSQGIKDSVSLRYAPVLPVINLDDTEDDKSIDHYFALSGQRLLTRNWSFSIADNFKLTDDPYFSSEAFAEGDQSENKEADTEEPTPTVTQEQQTTSLTGDELTKDAGRKKYWTNALSASTNYTFSETGSLGGGYTYSVLRNDSGGDDYDEYDKHSFFANIAYGFSQSWQTSFGANYIRGIYDNENVSIVDLNLAGLENEEIALIGLEEQSGLESEEIQEADINVSDDLDQYGANARLDYIHSTIDSFPVVYDFSGTKYDAEIRQDNYAHNLTLGWDHAFNSRTRIIIGGGPSYADAEGVKGEWDYNFYLNFTRDYEHASFGLLLDKRYDTQNFTGSNDSGLKDTYNARATFNYEYTQNLSFNAYGAYRWESTFTPQRALLTGGAALDGEGSTGELSLEDLTQDGEGATGEASISDFTTEKNVYEAGVGLSYSFLRYYNAGVRYVYYVSDGEQGSDQYSDHRIMLTLTASKDLWRW